MSETIEKDKTIIDGITFKNSCHRYRKSRPEFTLCGIPTCELIRFHPNSPMKLCLNPDGHNNCKKCLARRK